MSTTETRDAAIRAAKRHVLEVVRNDWVFEPSSTTSDAPASTSASATPAAPEQQWLEWRLREYDSSGSELEPQDEPEPEPDSPGEGDRDREDGGSSSDSSRVVTARERRRKRRRQREEEEMRWNIGLRTWVERRDAWTGARSKEEVGANPTKTTTTAGSASETATAELAARTGSSLAIAEKEGELQQTQTNQAGALNEAAKESTETGLTVPGPEPSPSPSHAESASSPPSAGDVRDPLIPVAPSFIPMSNPVRAAITPAMYPSIYSKVVVQALTPTVPINLADVVKAIVQGWKSDGQWPPKPTQTSIVLPDDSIVRKNGNAAGDAQASHESKRRSSVVGAVKKVFHFSGFHSNPFHRRGSSHGSHGGHPEAHDGHPKDGGSDPPGAVHPSR